MGVEELPSSGNKFTGSRMIVPGVGLNTYRVQKNDKFSIRRNPFANSINASPTPRHQLPHHQLPQQILLHQLLLQQTPQHQVLRQQHHQSH